MSYYGDRNFQLQGSYTRYYDGLKAGYDSEFGPNKRRNFATMKSAIRAAQKELRANDKKKIMGFERKTNDRGFEVLESIYDESGARIEWCHSDDYSWWHTDAVRIVDRETQKVLWES